MYSAHGHRDLKPRNLLINGSCDLKICDFGLARLNFHSKEGQTCLMTEHVCTRWYRAPEVLCSWKTYTNAIDVWSIGCILAEMLLRTPLFPGANAAHQLSLIISLLGTQPEEFLRKIPNKKCQRFLLSLPPSPGHRVADVCKDATPQAIDLISMTLQFHSDNRISVAEALNHPYVAQLSCPEDEPGGQPLDPNEFEFELRKVTTDALREELFSEALHYYPEKKESHLEGLRYDVKEFELLELEKGHDNGDGDDDDDDDDDDGEDLTPISRTAPRRGERGGTVRCLDGETNCISKPDVG
eukprot:NODE_2256_length_967_cov_277.178728.p1 GENE.NODE_2256_length_967_cov_277.178728~~NODE_2256_length_967_cov_277.178728.p1  ORF type:complete len:298 (+),score=61.72 NODE_2256_length_967_cov_277.178728:2-895(+)